MVHSNAMPRSARLDAPGVLHHVMGRGIERRKIFLDDRDREDFLLRPEELVKEGSMEIYAWSLLPNHFHLLCKIRKRPFVEGVLAEADEKAKDGIRTRGKKEGLEASGERVCNDHGESPFSSSGKDVS